MSNERHRIVAGEINSGELSHIREAVCVMTEKVYDTCRNKECIEDARVIFRDCRYIRWLLDHAINVKVRDADVVNVYTDLEPVPFKRGFFTVDVKFFIKVTLEFFVPEGRGTGTRLHTVKGLVVFDLKTILFGSEGEVKIFSSHFVEDHPDIQHGTRLVQNNLPSAKVEVAEPIALNAKIVDRHHCHHHEHDEELSENQTADIERMLGPEEAEPVEVAEERHDEHDPDRVVEVTLGLFSIIKLVRMVQLLIPAFDFCVPTKNCVISTEENPCELFETIEFPVEEFFPPQVFDFPGAEAEERRLRREGNEEKREEHRDERQDRRDDRR